MTERVYDPVLCLKAFLWWGIHVFVNPSYIEKVGSYMQLVLFRNNSRGLSNNELMTQIGDDTFSR